MDPAAFLRKLGGRTMAVHFKDLKANLDNTTEMAEIGEGNLNRGKMGAGGAGHLQAQPL